MTDLGLHGMKNLLRIAQEAGKEHIKQTRKSIRYRSASSGFCW